MQFLWNLLPGARETRNDVVVGYAWLTALGFWIGVPNVPNGPVHGLIKAVGPVGIGVAVSVIAYLVGSFSGDLVRLIPGLREARSFTSLRVGQIDPAIVLRSIDEKAAAELERLEGAIGRNSAEVSLRLSLVPPILVGGRSPEPAQ